MVSGGQDHACIVRSSDNTAACWGDNAYGESTVPAALASAAFKQVAAGGHYTCGVRDTGALACWGHNQVGQTNAPTTGSWTKVAVGPSDLGQTETSCAVDAGGAIACWGGWAGIVNAVPAGSFKQVGVGYFHACALANDGSISCWGQAGLGRTEPPPGTFTAISVGQQFSCAIKAGDGTIACWGNGPGGPAGSFTQLAVGTSHVCGVKNDHTLGCSGFAFNAAAGTYQDVVPPAGAFGTIGSGATFSCAGKNGAIACFGFGYPAVPPSIP
jgi:alpha-tubulin suppressor-like RCC1 family protein